MRRIEKKIGELSLLNFNTSELFWISKSNYLPFLYRLTFSLKH